jgi:hypothetical protein
MLRQIVRNPLLPNQVRHTHALHVLLLLLLLLLLPLR